MFFDFARKFQITFQDPATPIAEGIIDLHHEIFHWLIIIFVPVVVIFLRIVIRSIRVWSDPQTIKNLQKRRLSYAFSGITHGTLLEIIWTITPTIILILIAIPSFGLIYAMDTIIDPDFTIKVIGNQWYRTYDFNYRAFLLGDINDIYASVLAQPVIAQPGLDTPVSVLRTSAEMSDTALKKYLFEQTARLWSHNLKNHLIDSYMLSENVLTKKKGVRLLSVDNPITLPIFTNIRVLITASDVLHSFAIPSFGIKMDATPGRLSAVPLFIERPGIFYGQCSELCGIGHGVMPIEILAHSPYTIHGGGYGGYILPNSYVLYYKNYMKELFKDLSQDKKTRTQDEPFWKTPMGGSLFRGFIKQYNKYHHPDAIRGFMEAVDNMVAEDEKNDG